MCSRIFGAIFKRKFSTSRSLKRVDDPLKDYVESLEADCHHADKLKPVYYLVAVMTPIVAAYAWYLEYLEWKEEKIHRVKFIPYRFHSIKIRDFPWGDGDHTLMFNPKKNFTAKGYETDEYGNPLPKN